MKTYLTDIWEQIRFMFPYCLRLYFAPAIGALIDVRTTLCAVAVDGASLQRIGRLMASPVTGAYRYICNESARCESDLKRFYERRVRQA